LPTSDASVCNCTCPSNGSIDDEYYTIKLDNPSILYLINITSYRYIQRPIKPL
jgi:hypothetical protein